MTFNARANLAHNEPVARRRTHAHAIPGALASILLAGAVLASAAPEADTMSARPTTPTAEDAPVPPQAQPPEIPPQMLQPEPASGKGRLALVIGGNRRWCTYPDDRIARPPQKPGTFERRSEVFTFAYQFTLSAVKRGQADEPLMLYTSPIFSTASWIPAFKLGQTQKIAPAHPIIAGEDNRGQRPRQKPKGPDTLVPRWHEQNRCVTMPERMDFDLAPGTYDVYMAFDLLSRDNSWAHRTIGYLTDVPVEAARRTRLDGLVNLGGGSERQVELQSFAIEPEATPSPATPRP
jgi:hypothetical protein